jgi:hypothetical protein
MASSASPAITEAAGDKGQGGSPMNSGPVAIASGMPGVMFDSPAVPGVLGPPEDDDIIVVDPGSKWRTYWTQSLYCVGLPHQ